MLTQCEAGWLGVTHHEMVLPVISARQRALSQRQSLGLRAPRMDLGLRKHDHKQPFSPTTQWLAWRTDALARCRVTIAVLKRSSGDMEDVGTVFAIVAWGCAC